MTAPVTTAFGGCYLDFAEVWPWLGMDNAPVGIAATRLQRLIDSACAVAQRGANRPFCPTRFQERHDGWSGEYIQLRYSPFLQLVSCTEWQSSGGPITLTESTPANPVEGLQIDYATSRIMRVFAGYSWPRPFFPGSRNIEVIYVAGFNPVPPDVWDATIDLVAYKWRSSQESPHWFQPPADEYGGQQTNPLFPGVPNRCAEVFEAYRLPTIG
jgi:hypothetical protein